MLSTDSEKSSRSILLLFGFALTFYLMEWRHLYPSLGTATILFGSACGTAWLGRCMNLSSDGLSTGLVCLQTGVSLLACEFAIKHVYGPEAMAIFSVGLGAQLVFVSAAWAWRIRGKESLDFKRWFCHFIFYTISVLILGAMTIWFADYFDRPYYYGGPNENYSRALQGISAVGFIMILHELYRQRLVKSSV
jgi:hypothetical protein